MRCKAPPSLFAAGQLGVVGLRAQHCLVATTWGMTAIGQHLCVTASACAGQSQPGRYCNNACRYWRDVDVTVQCSQRKVV